MSQVIDFYRHAPAAEIAREMARQAERRNVRNASPEAARHRGVSFGGMGPTERPAEPTPEQALQAAIDAVAKQRAFNASPRGRFLEAIVSLQRPGGMYAFEAEVARKAWDRSFQFADLNDADCIHEIGVALEALHAVPGKDADEARLALAELLMRPTTQEAA